MAEAGAFFLARPESPMPARHAYSAQSDRATGGDLRSTPEALWPLLGQEMPQASSTHPMPGSRAGQGGGVAE